LNQKLSAIKGVVDGVFYMPNETDLHQRLIAFVVAPSLSKDDILNQLKQSIDAAFLPRPLILVDELPRNATGKLPQRELINLLDQQMLAS
jgi:acyl-coenzyme A synthetase/AMP-(fatty) acid ligase